MADDGASASAMASARVVVLTMLQHSALLPTLTLLWSVDLSAVQCRAGMEPAPGQGARAPLPLPCT